MKYIAIFLFSQILLLSAAPVKAADIVSDNKTSGLRFTNSNFSFLGGVGYASLRADELVYDGDRKVSQLIWESDVPILTAATKVIFENDFTLAGNFAAGLTGNSYMRDYDWITTPPSGYSSDAWSHRSVHPDTQLVRYWTADLALGRNFQLDETFVVNLHGGFKYTNMKWSAYGGSAIYSSEGAFRNIIGDLPDGQRGISYEQTYPVTFLGAEAVTKLDNWSFSVQVRGGLAFRADDEDHHWRRDLRFVEKFKNTPFLSLGTRADYAVSERVSLFFAGNFEQYFHRTGDTELYNMKTGQDAFFPNGAGMKFRSFSVSGGFKYQF
ncbi:MAG: omptin family outer membrane protease [Brucellaceae bacterium]|jgi:outer membrane protease|nr:omptin family outer membrane protease [Brucellaceae bacterium]